MLWLSVNPLLWRNQKRDNREFYATRDQFEKVLEAQGCSDLPFDRVDNVYMHDEVIIPPLKVIDDTCKLCSAKSCGTKKHLLYLLLPTRIGYQTKFDQKKSYLLRQG